MGCIDLLQDAGGAVPSLQDEGTQLAVESKGDVQNGRSKKDRKLGKNADVECSGCGRWMKACDADVDGMLASEVEGMEVFCLRCVYGVVSVLRKELRETRDDVRALGEAISISPVEVREFVTEFSRIRSAKIAQSDQGLPQVPEGVADANLYEVDTRATEVQSPSLSEDVSQDRQSYAEAVHGTPPEQQLVTPPPSQHSPPTASPAQEDGFTLVQHKKKKARLTINIVGDSMVRNTTKIIKCSEEGSGCCTLRGAGIKQVMAKAVESAEQSKDGMLVIEGGGNSLRALGVEETVASVINNIKKIKGKNKKLKIAVVSILPRPRENKAYEKMRTEANKRLQSRLCMLKADIMKNKEEGDVSFLDMDLILTESMFCQDGVHFNTEGDVRLGRRILQWIKEKGRSQVGAQ